jgi:dTMP kinase
MPFVVFEGGEGVGKSTQLARLAESLRALGCEVVTTREPGGTPFADKLRALFKQVDRNQDEPTPWTELLVVAAARAQHLDKVIRPLRAKDRGKTWILCDRFLDSALVYQGLRGAIGLGTVLELHRLFMSEADRPDATLILDCEPSAALERVQSRRATPEATTHDRLDTMARDIHNRLREGFLKLVAEQTPYPCGTAPARTVIDAAQSPDAVALAIRTALGHLWP